jgi:hypothetical protein
MGVIVRDKIALSKCVVTNEGLHITLSAELYAASSCGTGVTLAVVVIIIEDEFLDMGGRGGQIEQCSPNFAAHA